MATLIHYTTTYSQSTLLFLRFLSILSFLVYRWYFIFSQNLRYLAPHNDVNQHNCKRINIPEIQRAESVSILEEALKNLAISACILIRIVDRCKLPPVSFAGL